MPHENLFFDVERPKVAKIVDRPLLRRVDSVGTLQAGSAIRAHLAISGDPHPAIPGLSMGRVHCFRDKVQEWTSLPLEKAPLPSRLMIVEDPQMSTTYWCQIFSDRTLILMAPEAPDLSPEGVPLLRTLPIVLRLTELVHIADKDRIDPAWRISLKPSGELVDFLVSPTGKPEDMEDFFRWEPRSFMQRTQLNALRTVLEAEIIAWGRQIAQLPWIAGTRGAPIAGIFGQEVPAPTPDLEGTPYAWPAAAPFIGFTDAQYQAAKDFLRLAWAWFVDTQCAEIDDAVLDVTTGLPAQTGPEARIDVSCSAVPSSRKNRKQVEKDLAAAFRKLLKHPAAPDGIEHMTGAAVVDTNKAGTRQKLAPFGLMRGRLTQDRPSAHERLAAHALFKPWEDSR